jgi:nitrite reductase/ring-hydroxylating ferredoxin subunit
VKGNKMNRADFLKRTCPKIGLSVFLAIGTLESCSKSEQEPSPAPIPTSDSQYEALLNKTLINGYYLEGKQLLVNIQKGTYTNLKTVGNYVNDETNGLLMVRKSETTIVVFDNCCPHQGTKNRWSFSNNRFTCANHGYAFGIDTGQVAPCNSNSQFGNLKSFAASLTKDLLTIQLG